MAHFRNYFQEIKLPDEHYLIDGAIAATLNQLKIPYVDEKEAIRTDHFFASLTGVSRKIDPTARLFTGGGVNRSLLGYIYNKVSNKKEKNSSLSTQEILKQMIVKDKEIEFLSALGMGSDVDLYVNSLDANKTQSLISETSDFINSLENKIGLVDSKSHVAYAVVSIGDVKSMKEQLDLSNGDSKFGGSERICAVSYLNIFKWDFG